MLGWGLFCCLGGGWFGFCSFSGGQAGLKLGKVQQDIGTSTFLMPVLAELQTNSVRTKELWKFPLNYYLSFPLFA